MAAGAAGAVFAGLLSACGGAKPSADQPMQAPPLAVQAVAAGPPSTTGAVLADGALKRRREMTLSFRIPGVITTLAVDEGDLLRRGQVIAALDPTAVQARLSQAEADLDRARRDAERLKGLVDRGAVSRQQYESQSTAVDNAEAAMKSAAFDRRWAELRAPADGVVLARTAQSGEVVQPGQAVVSMADAASPLVLRVALPDKDALRVRPGASATVAFDALPGVAIPGRVSRIGQQAQAASGEIIVEITVAGRGELRSGMIGRAQIATAPAGGRSFQRVPAEAVLEAEGQQANVLMVEPGTGRAHRLKVGFGGFDGDDALIIGAPVGARLITSGAGFAVDGQKVVVVDPKTLTAP